MEQIGPYRIVRKIGEGGMGVVYAAHDERLGRSVAIKTIRDSTDALSRERFLREARAAAGVNHPNVCQLFDIGDHAGSPFLVMELLEGEALADRLSRGALPLREAVQIELSILTALDALHSRGFVHRDLKPSNVFLTKHAVKLLDFGLARETLPPGLAHDATTVAGPKPITVSGMILGTPKYMAPEQLLAAPVDGRTDLFAAGSILYEMISGSPPFNEDSPMKLFHAVVYENAPNLAGSASITAVNRIIHRALAKRADDRYQSASAMAQDLREIMLMSDTSASVSATRVTRLIVLPFRILRSDPETDFLAYAVPEAITTSLASVRSMIVRSSIAGARFAAESLDLKKLAEEADVDVALTGTILRAGDQIRATTQLVEVPGGTMLWSLTSQSALADLFDLQDKLTQRIVESLQIPLTDREARVLKHDVPATPHAHEFFLRATQQGESPESWAIARDLYLRALDEDPRYAPAWARLARIYLLIGKFTGGDAASNYSQSEAAIKRALDLNPDLTIAHNIYASLEVTTGRAKESVLRLLDAVARGTNDPGVFAGLVTSLRYCGLLDASAAAHEQARQLDPNISTSAAHTYWMMGRFQDAIATVDPDRDLGDAAFIFEAMGDLKSALAVFDDRKRRLLAAGARPDSSVFTILEWFVSALEYRKDEALRLYRLHKDFPDPEGKYYSARSMARLGEIELAITELDKAERGGFFCYPFFVRDAWVDPLRNDPRFIEILRRAESRMHDAQRAFESHPGSRVLNVGARR
ncbi:MAG TPA: protein kinase [Thermoanaerobaculia bacterium]|nr:protein kinase [Thermoanaerobaculia bacterium]